MTDLFSRNTRGLTGPSEYATAVSPDDDGDLAFVSRALFVGGAGNVALVTSRGSAVTFTGVVAGSVLPIRVKRVKATGTTATNLVALW